MFSKMVWKKSIGALCVLTLLLSACDSKVGEKPPPLEAQEFAGARCLTETQPVVKDFVKGTAKDQDVTAAWNCVIGAVEKFKRYVRGTTEDRYTSQELATFLEDNFLESSASSRPITPALQLEFMKVKQILVGGSTAYLSLSELDRLLSLFRDLRAMTLRLNPYMKVYSLNWVTSNYSGLQKDAQYFEEANKELQSAAKTLASLIEKNESSYKLSDFVLLTENLSVFFGEKWTFPKEINKYIPIVRKVKKALAGGDENSVTPSEWRRFALLGARGYVQYLRYHYFIKSVPETGSGYQLSYLSRTVEDLLSVFQDLVAEKPEGVVSRQEALDLLKTLEVVWPEFKVSEVMIVELMKIKQLFFGGSAENFSTKDFGTARGKVSRIKMLVEKFLPYYSIYSREWEPDLFDPEEAQRLFLESQSVLEATVREAGNLFEESYDLNNLATLAREIERLYPSEGRKNLESVTIKALPLLIDLKKMILGGNDALIQKNQWSSLLSFGARFYAEFLYYGYFLKGQPLEQPQTLNSVSLLANQSLDIFRDLLRLKPEQMFTRKELNKIVDHLIRLELLPQGISRESIDAALVLLLNNVLVAPEARIDGYTPNALTENSIEIVRREFQVWYESSLFIAQMTEPWKPEEGYYVADLLTVLKSSLGEEALSPALKSALQEFLLVVDSPVPMTFDGDSRVLLSKNAQPLFTAVSLRQLNLNRTVARILIRSFVTSKDRLNSYAGVNLPEVEGAYFALKPLLVEMGLVNASNMGFASSRFMEANIFVPHSDGSNLTSQAEMTDLIGMIFSGLSLNEMLRKELINVCFNGVEQKDTALVSLSCARKAYKDSMPAIMTSMPDYLRFMKTVSSDVWAYYMNNIFKAAGYVSNSKNLAALEDIALAPHVIQYVEMLYLRFDKNRDGYISTTESLKAFPAFKGILRDLAKEDIAKGTIKEKDLLDIFTFILRYGKPPKTLREKLRFVASWRGQQDKWDVWADRVQMSQILGYIADEVSKQSKKKAN